MKKSQPAVQPACHVEDKAPDLGTPDISSEARRRRVKELHELVLAEVKLIQRLARLCDPKASGSDASIRKLILDGLGLLSGYGCLWEPPDDERDAVLGRAAREALTSRLRLLRWLEDLRLPVGSKLPSRSVHDSVFVWSDQISARSQRRQANWPTLKRQVRRQLSRIPFERLDGWLHEACALASEANDPIDYPTLESLPKRGFGRTLRDKDGKLPSDTLRFLACCPMVDEDLVTVEVICYRMTSVSSPQSGYERGSLAKATALHTNIRRRLIPPLREARWIYSLPREKIVQTIPPGPVLDQVLHERNTRYKESLRITECPREAGE